MATASFYLLDKSHHDAWHAILEKTTQLSSLFCQQGMRIYIVTNTLALAQDVDEYLWRASPAHFVPHNLVGEGPRGGAQVEIGWLGVTRYGHRQILINLSDETSAFAPAFAQVVDFVPLDETGKLQARERYKIYRQAGCQMHALAIDNMT